MDQIETLEQNISFIDKKILRLSNNRKYLTRRIKRIRIERKRENERNKNTG
jgi:chorismate mutase